MILIRRASLRNICLDKLSICFLLSCRRFFLSVVSNIYRIVDMCIAATKLLMALLQDGRCFGLHSKPRAGNPHQYSLPNLISAQGRSAAVHHGARYALNGVLKANRP